MDEDHDPLDEAPLDPLDEQAYDPLDEAPRSGSCPEEGFALTVARGRGRAVRLVASPPPKRFDQKVTQRRKRAFLRHLAATGNVTLAAASAGWGPDRARAARKADPAFSEAWDVALEVAADIVDAAIWQRAVHGVEEEVWRMDKEGNPVLLNRVTRYSDPLLIHLSKGLKPEKYRERHEVQHEGSKGGVLVVPGTIPLEQWSAAAAAQQGQYREAREPE